jgi:hypothetical protein
VCLPFDAARAATRWGRHFVFAIGACQLHSPPTLASACGGGIVAAMKTTLMALGLCLTLVGAEKKKTDVEKDGYKGRVTFRSLFRRSGLNVYDSEKLTLPKNPKSDLDDLPKNFLGINNYGSASV